MAEGERITTHAFIITLTQKEREMLCKLAHVKMTMAQDVLAQLVEYALEAKKNDKW